jgi:iron-sulfur cluster assembly protein
MTQIEITGKAQRHIVDMVRRSGKSNVILDIVPGGCNGYEYKWTTTDEVVSEDGVVNIRLDTDIVMYLRKETATKMYASIITMKQEGLSSKLDIINPNVAYSCGCGESINFK